MFLVAFSSPSEGVNIGLNKKLKEGGGGHSIVKNLIRRKNVLVR